MKPKAWIVQDTSSSRPAVLGRLYVEQPLSAWLKANRAGRVLQYSVGSTGLWTSYGGAGKTNPEDRTVT